MLRWHGVVSICLALAFSASGVAIAQDAASPRSRLLRSVPLQTAPVVKEPSTEKTPVRIQLQQRTRKIEIDAQVTPPSRADTGANRRPSDSVQPAPANSHPQRSRRTLASILDGLGAKAPYDLSSSRKYLVASEKNGGGLVLCDIANQRRLRVLEDSSRRYAVVEISGDARWIAAVRSDDRNHIDLWRADNGRLIGTLNAAKGGAQQLEFSDAGDELRVTGAGGEGIVFSVPAGDIVGGFGTRNGASAATPGIRAPQFSPRIGAAPSASAGGADATTDQAQPPVAPPRKEFAMPRIAAPEPEADTAAPPTMAKPPVIPKTEIQPKTAIAPPKKTAPPAAAPREPAPSEPAPREPAPREPAPSEPAMAAPPPRAMMRSVEAEEPREESTVEAAPSATFDDVTSALPETAGEPPPEASFAPVEAAPPSTGAADTLPETAAEPPPDAPAAPGNSTIDAPTGATAEPPASDRDPTSITVHFATNRNRLAPKDRAWLVYFQGFFSTLPAFVIYALVVFALLIFPWFGKRKWAGFALVAGAVVLCAMASLEAYVRSQLRDELSGELYGSHPTELSYGACQVSVPLPRNRQAGELNRPVSVWVFEAPENPEKHFMLRKVTEHADQDAFFQSLSAEFAKAGGPAALLFIHGYNVSFEDALFRTAQLAVDLKFAGAAITFSWPSYADPVKYTFDEQNAEVSIPAFHEFLEALAVKSGAQRIHVIAHSMGNRVLAGAMERMDPQSREKNKSVFREVVLAAPDIDRRVFESQVLPHIVDNAQHCTLYASSRDRALLISRYFHNYQRLGETQPELIVANGMDTIDASLVDTSLLGHSYIGDAQSIVSDLHDLVVGGKRPLERLGLESFRRGDMLYWSIKPFETAADAGTRR